MCIRDSYPRIYDYLAERRQRQPETRALQERTDDARNAGQRQLGTPDLYGNHRKMCIRDSYAFAIWVGMGVAGVIRLLRAYCKMQELPAAALASVLCLFVPIQMAGQTWDDHDRSGRFVARDFGQNYLMTLRCV